MKRGMTILFAGLLAVMSLIGGGARHVSAAEPRCQVEHRSPAAIVESAGSGDTSVPLPDPVPYVVPEGVAATPETVARVEALMETMAECVNDGDIVGFLSLVSNDFLVRHFGDMDLSLEELIEIAASPVPAPDDGLLYVSDVRDVTQLADGRIAALVLLEQGQSDRPELTSVITFVERDGSLSIDAWQPVTLESSSGGGWQVVEGEGYNGVIVPGDLVADFLYGFFNEPIQGSWTPSAEQIATLEANLPAYLESAPAAAPDLHERVADYHRQYLGYVIEGRALIFVNAFCSVPGIEWTSDMVFVMDGGDCYFVVSYDVTTGEFLDLRINGEA